MSEGDKPLVHGFVSKGPPRDEDWAGFSVADIERARREMWRVGLRPVKKWKRISKIVTEDGD